MPKGGGSNGGKGNGGGGANPKPEYYRCCKCDHLMSTATRVCACKHKFCANCKAVFN